MAQAHIRASIEDRFHVDLVVGRSILGSLGELIEGYEGAFLVVDSMLPSNVKDLLLKAAETVGLLGYLEGGGEGSKELEWVVSVWRSMAERGVGRRSVVVVAGGGALLDSAGFAAATFMRGLDTVYVPTTSLAMLDAAVGGKTGVNLGGYKNVVGAFHHPRLVAADVSILAGLPSEPYRQGFAEAVKHAALDGESSLSMLESAVEGVKSRDVKVLEGIVEWSLKFKLSVVSRDFRERGLRRILNLGHTVGHAIESASGFAIPHGDAVAMGMVVELGLSVELAGLEADDAHRIIDVLRLYDLPVSPPDALLPEASRYVRGDKKRVGSRIAMPLLEKPGKPVIVPVELSLVESVMRSGVWKRWLYAQ